MASPERLVELKAIHSKIFTVTIDGIDITFRPLTFNEYNHISNSLTYGISVADVEDYIVQTAVVDPIDFDVDDILSGSVTSLSEHILDISGFNNIDVVVNALDEARSLVRESIEHVFKAFIFAATPKNTISDEFLGNLTIYEMLYEVALAEQIIEVQQKSVGVDGISIRMGIASPSNNAQDGSMSEDNVTTGYNVEKSMPPSRTPDSEFRRSRSADNASAFGTALTDDPIAQRLMHDLG